MPLFLAEVDVLELLDPADALPVIEGSFARLATGAALNLPRARLALENGYFAVMAATDTELEVVPGTVSATKQRDMESNFAILRFARYRYRRRRQGPAD